MLENKLEIANEIELSKEKARLTKIKVLDIYEGYNTYTMEG